MLTSLRHLGRNNIARTSTRSIKFASMSSLNQRVSKESSTETSNGQIEEAIRSKLLAAFNPDLLVIANDSWKHSSHAAMREVRGGNGETHFAVEIVSSAFEGKATLQRHRLIYTTLGHELKNGVHALQLKAKTPAEVADKQAASQAAA